MKIRHIFRKITHNSHIIAIVSLIWLLFRSGPKPDRISYPCQQTAANNVKYFFFASVLVQARRVNDFYHKGINTKSLLRNCAAVCLLFLFVYYGNHLLEKYKTVKEIKKNEIYKKIGPIGKPFSVTGAVTFLTVPHALALDSPHRVVSVHDSSATSWPFICGYGTCPDYYGDYVDQTIVDEMVDTGIMELTKTNDISQAWQTILPAYQTGQIISIKVNFNDSIMGGGTVGYGDNDTLIDALPQIVNSIVGGLKDIGVQEEDIAVFDASRYITDRFRARIIYPGITYFDGHGNGADVQRAEFISTDPDAEIDFTFTGSGYSETRKLTDVLVNSDYLINIPIMKRHSDAGITLSMKNHFGSVNSVYDMHSYIFPDGSNYNSTANPILDINNNPHIRDKTVLIVGDGLYGTLVGNNMPPSKWTSFNNDSPNILFFSVDPVAIDSVMYDYLRREEIFDSSAEDILILAAQAGLGVHERWNNDYDREYTVIDYVEFDVDSGLCKGCSCLNYSVRIDGANPDYFISLQEAYNYAGDEDIIQSQEMELTESINININKSVIFLGGYDCDFTANNGLTTLNGTLTISDGTAEFNNFIIK